MLFMRQINISSQWHHNTKPTVAPLPANERWSFETHTVAPHKIYNLHHRDPLIFWNNTKCTHKCPLSRRLYKKFNVKQYNREQFTDYFSPSEASLASSRLPSCLKGKPTFRFSRLLYYQHASLTGQRVSLVLVPEASGTHLYLKTIGEY